MHDPKKERYIETDGSFFEEMAQMERRILTKLGDNEALAILDAEKAAFEAEDELDEDDAG